MVSESNRKSKYWLSPGVDVPTQQELKEMVESRKLGGFYVDWFAEEALFVPTNALMQAHPLTRLNILGDLLIDLDRTYTHAVIEYFRELQRGGANSTVERDIEVFRRICECSRIEWYAELQEAILQDHQYRLFGFH